MAGPLEITAANFEAEVLKSTTPVLIDFWAPWCGPCRMVAHGITGIPALLFFEGGQVVDTVVGAVPKSTLQKHVDGVLGEA